MPVSLKHHLTVVISLLTAFLVVSTLLVMAYLRVGPFQPKDTFISKSYLRGEEGVLISPKGGQVAPFILPIKEVLFEYIEVTDGCGPYFQGQCVNVRSGPGTDFPIVTRLRNGIVLKVGGKVERDGQEWYKVVFDEWIRYPERITGDWFVAADYVTPLLDEGEKNIAYGVVATSSKRIIVELSTQTLYAYDGDPPYPTEAILISDYNDVYARERDGFWRYESRTIVPVFGGVPVLAEPGSKPVGAS